MGAEGYISIKWDSNIDCEMAKYVNCFSSIILLPGTNLTAALLLETLALNSHVSYQSSSSKQGKKLFIDY